MNYELQKDKIEEYEKNDALNRNNRAEKIINFLDKINAYDFVQNLSEHKNKIDFDQFKSLLLRLNGLVQNISISKRDFDGKNVEISGGFLGEVVLPPKHEDKENILEFAFDSAKDLANTDNAYVVPAVINSLHMFNDGNGRTSRLVHLLFNSKNKESFESDLRKALGVDGRFDTYDINPGFINYEIETHNLQEKYGWNFNKNKEAGFLKPEHYRLHGGIASAEYEKITSSNKVFLENISKLKEIAKADSYYILTAIIESLSQDQYNYILWNNTLISPVKMESLTEKDWNNIFNFYYKLKKEHAETLVWIFKNPGKYKSPDNDQETLKDCFIRRIKEKYQQNKKI